MNKQVKNNDDNDDDDNAFALKTPNWLELFDAKLICTHLFIVTQVIVDKIHVNMFKVDLKELKC